MEGERWIPTFVGMTFREVGMTETSNEITTLAFSKLAMTEGLKLTIFTYKWGKCVKSV